MQDERKPDKAFLKEPDRGKGVYQKVYLILQRLNVSSVNGKQPHDFLIDVKLNRTSAEKIRDLNPGSYILKTYATR